MVTAFVSVVLEKLRLATTQFVLCANKHSKHILTSGSSELSISYQSTAPTKRKVVNGAARLGNWKDTSNATQTLTTPVIVDLFQLDAATAVKLCFVKDTGCISVTSVTNARSVASTVVTIVLLTLMSSKIIGCSAPTTQSSVQINVENA